MKKNALPIFTTSALTMRVDCSDKVFEALSIATTSALTMSHKDAGCFPSRHEPLAIFYLTLGSSYAKWPSQGLVLVSDDDSKDSCLKGKTPM